MNAKDEWDRAKQMADARLFSHEGWSEWVTEFVERERRRRRSETVRKMGRARRARPDQEDSW